MYINATPSSSFESYHKIGKKQQHSYTTSNNKCSSNSFLRVQASTSHFLMPAHQHHYHQLHHQPSQPQPVVGHSQWQQHSDLNRSSQGDLPEDIFGYQQMDVAGSTPPGSGSSIQEVYASHSSGSGHVPVISSNEYSLRHWRRPPPSPQSAAMVAGQILLSRSADRPSAFTTAPRQLPGQFRTLTPPSGVFSSHLTTATLGSPSSGITNHQHTLPAGRACTSHNSNDNLLSAGEMFPPPRLATSGVLSPSPNKVVLRPYVFRPVHPSTSSAATLSAHTSRPCSRSPHRRVSSGELVLVTEGNTTQQLDEDMEVVTFHQQSASSRRHSQIRATPTQDAYDIRRSTSAMDPSAPSSRSVSRAGGGLISRNSVNSNPADVETQLRWKETELRQLRATMERNENAMTQVFEERLTALERQLNLERQKTSRLELALAAGRRVEKDVTVQTCFSGNGLKKAADSPNSPSDSNSDQHLQQQLAELTEQFDGERARWLEEKAKVITYQRQLQLNYLQLARKAQRLETELQQTTLELEHKSQQLVLVESFNQLEVGSSLQSANICGDDANPAALMTSSAVYNTSGMRRSASSEPTGRHGKSSFLHFEPEETAC